MPLLPPPHRWRPPETSQARQDMFGRITFGKHGKTRDIYDQRRDGCLLRMQRAIVCDQRLGDFGRCVFFEQCADAFTGVASVPPFRVRGHLPKTHRTGALHRNGKGREHQHGGFLGHFFIQLPIAV